MKRLACLAVLLFVSSAQGADKVPRVDRLERVVRAIKDVPPARFDMTTYGRHQPEPGSEEFYGCALGHAITNDVAFSRDGLHLDWTGLRGGAELAYGHERGLSAAAVYFQISYHHAYYLFGGEPRTPTKEVALIRTFIAEHRPRPITNIAHLIGGGLAVAVATTR